MEAQKTDSSWLRVTEDPPWRKWHLWGSGGDRQTEAHRLERASCFRKNSWCLTLVQNPQGDGLGDEMTLGVAWSQRPWVSGSGKTLQSHPRLRSRARTAGVSSVLGQFRFRKRRPGAVSVTGSFTAWARSGGLSVPRQTPSNWSLGFWVFVLFCFVFNLFQSSSFPQVLIV